MNTHQRHFTQLLSLLLVIVLLSLGTVVLAQDGPVVLGELPEPSESGMAAVNDIEIVASLKTSDAMARGILCLPAGLDCVPYIQLPARAEVTRSVV